MTISLIDVSTYLPGDPVPADYYAQFADSDELRDNLDVPRADIPPPRRRGRDSDRHGRTRRRRSWWTATATTPSPTSTC